MTNDQALACTLNGPELIERLASWQKVTSQALSRRTERGRMVSTYPRDEQVIGELRRLIAAEAECCSFMRFEIHEEAGLVTVELRVPDDMSDMLEVIAGLMTGQDPASATASG